MEGKKKVFYLGLIIVAAAIFFRFYKIDQVAPFLGDQGRDLLEIREQLVAGKLPLVGPLSNFGVHAGPIYYYLTIPPLILANFHPLGPILFFTFLGVISTWLIFLIGSKTFSPLPAFFAALLYACSPSVVRQNLGFWNPIPIPLFSLLIIYALYQIKEQKKYFWLGFLGLFLGIVVQFYPPAFLILAIIFAWILLERPKSIIWSLAGLALFFLSFLPMLIFQLQNNFADFRNLLLLILEKFFLPAGGTKSFNLGSIFASQFQPLTSFSPNWLNIILGVAILISGRKNYWHKFLIFWLLAGVFAVSLYPGTIHEHYASPIWAIPFLLLASFLKQVSKHLPQRLIFGLATLLIFWQVYSYFKSFSAPNDLRRTQATTEVITSAAGDQPFSLLLFSSPSPSDAHLRYWLSLKNAPLQKIGAAKHLFVVCENNSCPEPKAVQNLKIVDSECLPNCAPLGEQKTINLADWQYLSSSSFSGGKIYLFEAAQTSQK